MRFKRNYVTIAYSIVYITLMLLCGLNVAALSYEYFAEDGMGIIFAILMTIGVILVFIASFFLREKAVLRWIQKETGALIIFEGIAGVILIGLGFSLIMDYGIENAIWFGAYLVAVYGVCRLLGGRLCALLGLTVSLSLSYFALSTGWMVFNSGEIISVLCILVPFFVFLILMKNIIPQFGQSNAVVIFALVVLCALFGAFICLNPLTAILCIGCGVALMFANIRSVDTLVTKGPFMGGFIMGGSAVFTVIMSFLLEKDLGNLFPEFEPGFSSALSGGAFIDYFCDKLHKMLSTVIFHAFDFGIFSIILLIFATMSGVYAIRRKLSAVGPLLLTSIFALLGYVMYDIPETHGYYLTFMLGTLSAYGFFNMLLPEFLSKYDEQEDEEEEMFDTESEADAVPLIDEIIPDPIVKEKVADENRESSKSDSEQVSQAASAVEDKTPSPEQSSPSVVIKDDLNDATGIDNDANSYMEWHVSNEYVREDELRKERQAAREKEIEVAKEIKEAKDSGKSEEEIQFIADAAEEEKKQSAPGRVLYTGEDTHPSAETISASIPPMSIKPADPYNTTSETRDMSQLENVGVASDETVQGSSRAESDTIVLSGYQNDSNFSAPVDILTAINDTEIPQVEIPDVPEVEETLSTDDQNIEEAAAAALESSTEANEAVEELSKAAASFSVESAGETAGADDDQQLDTLLERLDVSDSIKRMSESAREDMADVIEHADDKTEAELVLKNEDYKFGTDEGEYGEVPTISELEDRWRAEEQLNDTPEEMFPDVVSAAEAAEEPSEEILGYEQKGEATTPVSLTAPEGPTDPTMDMLSFDSVANTSEEKLDNKPPEPENGDVSLDHFEFTTAEPDEDAVDIIRTDDIAGYEEDIAEDLGGAPEDSFTFTSVADDIDASEEPVSAPEAETESETFSGVQPAIMEEVIPEIPAEEPEAINEPEPEDSFVSFRDMANATVPEEILPITGEPVQEIMPSDDSISGFEDSDIIKPDIEAEAEDSFEAIPEETYDTVSEQFEEPVLTFDDASDLGDELSADEPAEPQGFVFAGLDEADSDVPVEEEIVDETPEISSEKEPKITKFEPERIERPESMAPKAEKKPDITPIINHTEQSPVYSFTRMDAGVNVPKEDDELLFIPKPGEETVPEPVEEVLDTDQDSVTFVEEEVPTPEMFKRPVPVDRKPMRPIAAELDETITSKKKDRLHTEEVVTRSAGGSRSYHKIVIK